MNKLIITKKLLQVLSIVCTISLLGSCRQGEDQNIKYRIENEQAFKAYASKKGYEARGVDGLNAKVYMKWTHHGTGKIHPIETSRVLCHYKLCALIDTNRVYYSNFSKIKPEKLTLYRKYNGQATSLMRGQSIALQNMVVGDECLVAIPWYLTYGDNEIKSQESPFTAYFFHVKLDGIIDEDTDN